MKTLFVLLSLLLFSIASEGQVNAQQVTIKDPIFNRALDMYIDSAYHYFKGFSYLQNLGSLNEIGSVLIELNNVHDSTISTPGFIQGVKVTEIERVRPIQFRISMSCCMHNYSPPCFFLKHRGLTVLIYTGMETVFSTKTKRVQTKKIKAPVSKIFAHSIPVYDIKLGVNNSSGFIAKNLTNSTVEH
jgi:hypothetical protein